MEVGDCQVGGGEEGTVQCDGGGDGGIRRRHRVDEPVVAIAESRRQILSVVAFVVVVGDDVHVSVFVVALVVDDEFGVVWFRHDDHSDFEEDVERLR